MRVTVFCEVFTLPEKDQPSKVYADNCYVINVFESSTHMIIFA